MTDIVEQLRNFTIITPDGYDVRQLAADEIETLRKRVAEWEEAGTNLLIRAEKAEAHIVELDRELINIRRSRRKAKAALAEARARLAAADRMAEAFMSLWDEIRDEQPLTGKSFRECKAAMRAYCKETGQ